MYPQWRREAMLFGGQTRTLVGAHRGASADAPENTFAAFDLAVEQGTELIECDVHLSADGRPVVLHDFDFDRVAGYSVRVASMSIESIERLDVGAWMASRFAGQRVPTLN